MRVSLKKSVIQPGVTPIENMFLDYYLPIVDEISLKVYLYLYKRIYASYKSELTFELISTELNLTKLQIINALKYWKNNSIIDYETDADGEISQIEFFSFFALYSGNVYEQEDKKNPQEKPLMNDKEYSKKIENIIGMTLKPHEITEIIDHIEETGHDWNMVYRGYKFADENGKSKSVKYVLGILRAWKRDNDILTEKDLDFYLANKDTRKIKKAVRLTGKKYIQESDKLTEKEKQEKIESGEYSSAIDLLERY